MKQSDRTSWCLKLFLSFDVATQSRDEQSGLKKRVDRTVTRLAGRIQQIMQSPCPHGCLHAAELHWTCLRAWRFFFSFLFCHI